MSDVVFVCVAGALIVIVATYCNYGNNVYRNDDHHEEYDNNGNDSRDPQPICVTAFSHVCRI